MSVAEAVKRAREAANQTAKNILSGSLNPETPSKISFVPIRSELPDISRANDAVKQATLSDALALYMRFVPIARIGAITGIMLEELKSYVYGEGGWKSQRDALHKELNEEIKQTHLARLKKITGVGITLIESCFEELRKTCQEDDTPITLEQASEIADIFSKLHKAKILEEATDEANKALSLSPQEIIRAFGQDPYLKHAIADAETIDVSDETLEQVDGAIDLHGKNPDTDSLADLNR